MAAPPASFFPPPQTFALTNDPFTQARTGTSAVPLTRLGIVRKFYLTLVRHGETHSNKDGVVAGQTDVPLSVVGASQATRLGERFRQARFTHWFSSDLSRAKATADLVMAVNADQESSPKELNMDPRIRERAFGEAEGLSWGELRQLAMKRNVKLHNYDPPDGESLRVFRARIVCFFTFLCRFALSLPNSTPVLYLAGAEDISRICLENAADDEDNYRQEADCPNPTDEEERGTEGSEDRETQSTGSDAKQSWKGEFVPEPEDADANIIVFTHGGTIRELSTYFGLHLGCDFHGRPGNTPITNTGFSQFRVTTGVEIETGKLCAGIECVVLRDSSHLK